MFVRCLPLARARVQFEAQVPGLARSAVTPREVH
jgi:hypothetical protein